MSSRRHAGRNAHDARQSVQNRPGPPRGPGHHPPQCVSQLHLRTLRTHRARRALRVGGFVDPGRDRAPPGRSRSDGDPRSHWPPPLGARQCRRNGRESRVSASRGRPRQRDSNCAAVRPGAPLLCWSLWMVRSLPKPPWWSRLAWQPFSTARSPWWRGTAVGSACVRRGLGVPLGRQESERLQVPEVALQALSVGVGAEPPTSYLLGAAMPTVSPSSASDTCQPRTAMSARV